MTLSPKPIFVKVLLIEQTLLKGASVSVRIRLRGMRLIISIQLLVFVIISLTEK